MPSLLLPFQHDYRGRSISPSLSSTMESTHMFPQYSGRRNIWELGGDSLRGNPTIQLTRQSCVCVDTAGVSHPHQLILPHHPPLTASRTCKVRMYTRLRVLSGCSSAGRQDETRRSFGKLINVLPVKSADARPRATSLATCFETKSCTWKTSSILFACRMLGIE